MSLKLSKIREKGGEMSCLVKKERVLHGALWFGMWGETEKEREEHPWGRRAL